MMGTIALVWFIDLVIVIWAYPAYDTIGKMLLFISLIPIIIVVRKYNKQNNINGVSV